MDLNRQNKRTARTAAVCAAGEYTTRYSSTIQSIRLYSVVLFRICLYRISERARVRDEAPLRAAHSFFVVCQPSPPHVAAVSAAAAATATPHRVDDCNNPDQTNKRTDRMGWDGMGGTRARPVSGQTPETPVVSKKSGHVYEKRLIVKYIDAEGKVRADKN